MICSSNIRPLGTLRVKWEARVKEAKEGKETMVIE
jgi:hypothetical protein